MYLKQFIHDFDPDMQRLIGKLEKYNNELDRTYPPNLTKLVLIYITTVSDKIYIHSPGKEKACIS